MRRRRHWISISGALVLVQCARLPPTVEHTTAAAQPPAASSGAAQSESEPGVVPLEQLTLEDLREDIAMVTCDAVPPDLTVERLPAHVWTRTKDVETQCAGWTASSCHLTPLHGKDWVLADHDYAAIRAPSGSWFGFSLFFTWMQGSFPEPGFASSTEMDFAWQPFAEGVTVLEVYLTEHSESWSEDSDVVEFGTAVQIAWCFAGTEYIVCTLEENLSSKTTSRRYGQVDAESGYWRHPVEGSEREEVMMDWKVAYPGDGSIRIETEYTPVFYCLEPQFRADDDSRR